MKESRKHLILDIIILVCELLFIFIGIMAVIIVYKFITIDGELQKDLALIITTGALLTVTLAAYIVSKKMKAVNKKKNEKQELQDNEDK